ncbi:MAG: 6-bladed beta-propeller, partial [Candidatus Nitrosocosmicus sp.]
MITSFIFNNIFAMSKLTAISPIHNFKNKWGSYGTGNGQFISPSGIATDHAGNVYVIDGGNNRVQKFDSNDTFITTWGSFGTGNGQFNSASGIAIDSYDNVYISNSNTGSGSNPIQKFDSNGMFITTWGNQGSENGQFISPSGIATDPSDSLFVTDLDNNRVQKFDSNGTFITTWGSYGTGNGQFISPSGIATDHAGNVYVKEGRNNRVQKFERNGKYITTLG